MLDLLHPLSPPTALHPLGTDELGRDMLARLLQGTHSTLGVAIPAALLALALGTLYGTAAGAAPAWLDRLLMRALDVVLALPVLVVLLAAAALTPTLNGPALALLIAAVSWPALARLVRNETRALRARDYVRAAWQMGASRLHIGRTHLLPGLARVLASGAAFLLGDAILALSALSFLGLGIQPPEASWGGLLASGLGFVELGAWWLVLPPALLIFAALLIASLIAERLAQH